MADEATPLVAASWWARYVDSHETFSLLFSWEGLMCRTRMLCLKLTIVCAMVFPAVQASALVVKTADTVGDANMWPDGAVGSDLSLIHI